MASKGLIDVNRPIYTINLGKDNVRIQKLLESNDICIISELCTKDRMSFHKGRIYGIGTSYTNQIEDSLYEYGLRLGMTEYEIREYSLLYSSSTEIHSTNDKDKDKEFQLAANIYCSILQNSILTNDTDPVRLAKDSINRARIFIDIFNNMDNETNRN